MSRATLKAIQAAAGNAGEAVYVDDVFSTYLYDGANGSTSNQAVTVSNGIDLYNEGGLIWIKRRDVGNGHALFDSQRDSFASYLRTEGTNAQSTLSGHVTANSNGNGFTLSSTGFGITNNTSPATYASWTFRKQPGFFDVVTYTGDGTSNRNISHSLNSVPGAILVKRTDTASSTGWMVWHRSGSPQSGTYALMVNYANSWGNIGADIWGTSGPNMTSTTFSVGDYSDVNASGGTYVAYLFAHDAQDFGTDSDESIIKCGSYTGTGASGNFQNLGWEPQYVLVKSASASGNWIIHDVMRGMSEATSYTLKTESSQAENLDTPGRLLPRPTGFEFSSSGLAANNASGVTYIYIAIRRPHKPASEFAATDLFAVDTRNSTGDGKEPGFRSGFPVDMNIFNPNIAGSTAHRVSSRLTGNKYLETSSTNAELTGSTTEFDYMNGWLSSGGTSADAYSWMFRRAPGFFDVVAYTGTGSAQNISHNLNSVPEMIVVKRRDSSAGWNVYHSGTGATHRTFLNTTGQAFANSGAWNNTAPTADIFTVGSNSEVNVSSGTFIAYLFATVPGISKVGSYSGTGSAVDVDCGFTSGARFVLIKRTDGTGSWYLFDTARGIVAGNDPMLNLNSNSAEFTGADYIDPLSSGFTVGTGGGSELNANGGNYIFLAIA